MYVMRRFFSLWVCSVQERYRKNFFGGGGGGVFTGKERKRKRRKGKHVLYCTIPLLQRYTIQRAKIIYQSVYQFNFVTITLTPKSCMLSHYAKQCMLSHYTIPNQCVIPISFSYHIPLEQHQQQRLQQLLVTLVFSCLVLCCLVLSYLFYFVLSCPILSCLVLSCLLLSYLILSHLLFHCFLSSYLVPQRWIRI